MFNSSCVLSFAMEQARIEIKVINSQFCIIIPLKYGMLNLYFCYFVFVVEITACLQLGVRDKKI